MKPTISGVGVLDKSAAIVTAVGEGPKTLADLVATTGYSRATVFRLCAALLDHRWLRRDEEGRYALGFGLLALGQAAASELRMAEIAEPVLRSLRDDTGESVQLYVRDGDVRVCVASLESPHGLRTIVTTGSTLPLDVGSGGHVLRGAAADQWLASVAEREAGVASVSAPVADGDEVVAAVSVSGPVQRLTTDPGARYGARVAEAARAIEAAAGLGAR